MAADSDPLLCDKLNERFQRPGRLHFVEGPGGLIVAELRVQDATARVFLHGAHVAAFQPAGHEAVLWMSPAAEFEPGKAIRGGVPICFPWFGPPHPPFTDDPNAPSHGLVRTQAWNLTAASTDEDRATVIALATQIGPHALCHEIRLEPQQLRMALTIGNHRDEATDCELALHTYLRVSDVREVSITGLADTDYLDKVPTPAGHNGSDRPGPVLRRQHEPVVRFVGETDRVYLDTEATCVLRDPGLRRSITVRKTGSRSTVVWNPWTEKAARLHDMPDDAWPGMCCIESGCIDRNAVRLNGGERHTASVTLTAERL